MNYSEIEFTCRDEFHEIMSGARLNFILFGESADVEWAKATELQRHEAAHFVDVRKLDRSSYNTIVGASFLDRYFYPEIGEFLPLPLVRSYITCAGYMAKYFEATDPNLEKVIGFNNFQQFLEYSRRQMSIFSVLWKDDQP